MVGVGVHVQAHDSVGPGVCEGRSLFGPGDVGVDFPVPEEEPHVVGLLGENPLHELPQVGVGGLDYGPGVSPVPEVYPEPEGPVSEDEAEVLVSPRFTPGVEVSLTAFAPLPFKLLEGLAGMVTLAELDLCTRQNLHRA